MGTIELRFMLVGDCESILSAAFPIHDGRLTFGWNGVSIEPCSHDDLLCSSVRFRDYIMEGGVGYFVRARKSPEGLELLIEPTGSNRDKYLPNHFRFHFQQAKLQLVD